MLAQTHFMKQTSVAPGKHAEIVLSISSPRSLFIDILVSNPDVKVVVALPDGKEIKEGEAEPGQPALTAVSDDQLTEAKELMKSYLVSGPGRHLFFVFPTNPPAGNYRVLFENPSALNSARVSCAIIPIGEVLLAMMKQAPGVNVIGPVKVPARSRETKLNLTLAQSKSAVLLDIAPSDARVTISLRLPNGALVTPKNAKEHGIEWHEMKWPPEDQGGDDFGFGLVIMMSTMLPVEGTHQFITFENWNPAKRQIRDRVGCGRNRPLLGSERDVPDE